MYNVCVCVCKLNACARGMHGDSNTGVCVVMHKVCVVFYMCYLNVCIYVCNGVCYIYICVLDVWYMCAPNLSFKKSEENNFPHFGKPNFPKKLGNSQNKKERRA